MNVNSTFFHLYSRSLRPCYQTKNVHATAMRSTLCEGCAHPRAGIGPIDVFLQEASPRDKPLNVLWGCGIGLMHEELAEQLGIDILRRELHLGRVHDSCGDLVPDWMTFHGANCIVVRGTTDALVRTCATCGRQLYHAGGKRYLCPRPAENVTLYPSNLSGLVIRPQAYEKIEAKKWRKLGVEQLEALDEPLDGIEAVNANPTIVSPLQGD